MIDHTARGSLLCSAISVLAKRDIDLVITSAPGEAYHFEMDGRPVTEADVITRAAMLDPTILKASDGDGPTGKKRVTEFPKSTSRRERVRARHRERSNCQSAR